MIDETEPIYPILKNRQEWEDRSDGDSLGLGHYTTGGLTIKQHMMIEFTKAIITASLSNNKVGQSIHRNSEKAEIDEAEYSAIMAEEYADALIKQFNKNGDK